MKGVIIRPTPIFRISLMVFVDSFDRHRGRYRCAQIPQYPFIQTSPAVVVESAQVRFCEMSKSDTIQTLSIEIGVKLHFEM